MALFPCTVCGKRYPGKSNKAYLGWTNGAYSDRAILNLDPFHLDQLREKVERQGKLIERNDVMPEDPGPVSATCTICTVDPVSVTWWLHLFDRTVGREVYVVDACNRCEPDFFSMAPEASRRPEK